MDSGFLFREISGGFFLGESWNPSSLRSNSGIAKVGLANGNENVRGIPHLNIRDFGIGGYCLVTAKAGTSGGVLFQNGSTKGTSGFGTGVSCIGGQTAGALASCCGVNLVGATL
jgi:hypothetical protein